MRGLKRYSPFPKGSTGVSRGGIFEKILGRKNPLPFRHPLYQGGIGHLL